MAQLYYQDSGGMIHQGKTTEEYQNDPFYVWDPKVHSIATSSQTFPQKWVRKRWYWLPVLGKFFTRTDGSHAILVAASTLFTRARWEEIEDFLEEHTDIERIVSRGNFKKLRRKIQRVENKGLITAEEAQLLADLVAHLP